MRELGDRHHFVLRPAQVLAERVGCVSGCGKGHRPHSHKGQQASSRPSPYLMTVIAQTLGPPFCFFFPWGLAYDKAIAGSASCMSVCV